MYSQYIRKYRVIVVDAQGTALDLSELRCKFVIEKAVDEKPNYSEITIYNLSAATQSSIIANGKKVILEAGYRDGAYGLIFSGEIIQPLARKEDGVTTSLTLICQDGDAFLNDAFTASTISSGATYADLIQIMIKSGEDVDVGALSPGLSPTSLVRGKVLFGKAADYLNQLSKSNDAQFYVEDGAVNIVKAEDYDSSTAVELNPMTGLIGIPEQTDDGVNATCLLNPRVKLNTLIYINASLVAAKQFAQGETSYKGPTADGVYRVIKMQIEGDTRGNEWYMQLEAITQSGAKPVGLTGDADNPWR